MELIAKAFFNFLICLIADPGIKIQILMNIYETNILHFVFLELTTESLPG